jgi:hypothetical protein
VRGIMALAASAAVAAAAPATPAEAELLSFEQLRAMCAGETADSTEFRTGSAHALLREIYRSRCRMYLLGIADGLLHREDSRQPRSCPGHDIAEPEIGDRLVEAVLDRTEAGEGGASEIVREVLRTRYGCG